MLSPVENALVYQSILLPNLSAALMGVLRTPDQFAVLYGITITGTVRTGHFFLDEELPPLLSLATSVPQDIAGAVTPFIGLQGHNVLLFHNGFGQNFSPRTLLLTWPGGTPGRLDREAALQMFAAFAAYEKTVVQTRGTRLRTWSNIS